MKNGVPLGRLSLTWKNSHQRRRVDGVHLFQPGDRVDLLPPSVQDMPFITCVSGVLAASFWTWMAALFFRFLVDNGVFGSFGASVGCFGNGLKYREIWDMMPGQWMCETQLETSISDKYTHWT